MSKTVHKTFSGSPLTPARKRRLANLAACPDSEIDFSDIPPLSDDFWANAVRNPFYRSVISRKAPDPYLPPDHHSSGANVIHGTYVISSTPSSRIT